MYLLRRGRAQRVVQIAQPLEHPGLAPAVLHVLQALEERSRTA